MPQAAVVNTGASQPYVLIFRQGMVHRQAVALGRLVDARVVVSGPLAAGDRVVVAGQGQLADGDRVEVAP